MDSVRTCLGCRQRVDPSQLLRVVARDGVATPDPSASMHGRGAWVHPTRECVTASIKRKAWSRALRESVDASQLLTYQRLTTEGLHPETPTEQAD